VLPVGGPHGNGRKEKKRRGKEKKFFNSALTLSEFRVIYAGIKEIL
jgi:hypothetical protein